MLWMLVSLDEAVITVKRKLVAAAGEVIEGERPVYKPFLTR